MPPPPGRRGGGGRRAGPARSAHEPGRHAAVDALARHGGAGPGGRGERGVHELPVRAAAHAGPPLVAPPRRRVAAIPAHQVDGGGARGGVARLLRDLRPLVQPAGHGARDRGVRVRPRLAASCSVARRAACTSRRCASAICSTSGRSSGAAGRSGRRSASVNEVCAPHSPSSRVRRSRAAVCRCAARATRSAASA